VCGDSFTIYPLDMPPLVFLADPQDIQAVLNADASSLLPGAGASSIAPLVGEQSFLLCEEDEHLHGRKVITPAFHKHMLPRQAAILTEVVERAVASWPLNKPFPLHPHLRSLTLTVILRIIFSDKDRELATLHEGLMQMLTISDSMLLQGPRLKHVPGWRKTWGTFIARRAEVDRQIHLLMRDRRASRPAHSDLLELLLTAENADGAPMSDRQIRDNLMSMIVAGHETIAGELAWAFQLLAHNPDTQRRLAEGLDNGTGEDYLTATVYESLRHRPVFIFAIPRKVATPTEIGDWTYRPPARLAACTYLMHHNPELYPDPHAFCPERFVGAGAQSRTWLPWGSGRKHCVGRHFALLEAKTIIRQVLSVRTVRAAGPKIEGPRWRSTIVVPRAGGRVILDGRARCC
jgi:cytochrome P450